MNRLKPLQGKLVAKAAQSLRGFVPHFAIAILWVEKRISNALPSPEFDTMPDFGNWLRGFRDISPQACQKLMLSCVFSCMERRKP